MEKQNPLMRIWELAKEEHSGLIKSVIFAIIGVLGGMIPYFAVSKILINLLNGNTDNNLYIHWALISFLGYLIKVVFYVNALSISHKSTFSVLKNIRLKILDKLPKMPLGTILETSSGRMKQIIVDQVESTETTLAHLVPEMTSNILGPVCIIIYLFVLDWKMALLSIVSIPVGMSFMGLIMRNYTERYEGAVRTNAEMNSAIVEYVGGIEVIKAFNQGNKSYAKFAEKVNANAAYFYNWMKECQFYTSLAGAISPTTMITTLPIGWIFYIKGSISIEIFITTIILSLGVAGPIISAMMFFDNLAKVGTIVDSIDKILCGEEQIHNKESVKFDNMNIELKDVSFGYTEEKEVLHSVNMNISESTMNAFVGLSGSGKSTIAKLIAGYWDIKSGSIKIGGIELKEIPLNQLYDLVSFVSQDNFLFDESIRENIRMGNIDATDEEIEKVSKLSGCHDFIMNLEDGYDTVAGSSGSHISGGERQRIAIARAMLKNAPIVILDEATAYIDPENEAIVQKAVAKLISEKTVIVIAHRLSTTTNSDKIFLIKDGRVADRGTHEELLNNNLDYRDMWNAHIGARDGE
ncbi:ABC transporter ATP-binding protein [Peptoniphilus sp. oral taxon 386]|uniref:ABC transporter ATP-binding protein n=1 Tax=Peptoniphilus sp. oral taxon 386 TaxID=652713 RepID=UPI0001DA9D06|nr:ABC transporter ATP-binding protein [Peptoniphilus sp. oral taxon 386]EFI42478.1 ABC transporter, ATP-binding protein [Peptoniphilus sp. oral taxon 386 str. F0131]